jgi:predicted O-methyltransferase YrrM
MGIPRVLGTAHATIPSDVPYLRADPAKLEKWKGRIDARGLKVGLAWAGNPLHKRDQYRSVPFERLSPLWGIQGVSYFSLQKQPLASDIEKFPPESAMFDLGPSLEDFSDTAAAIAHMDVVICVDTSVAHLAGALGKPVLLMLPEVGDFRWMLTREDSPWYPTMRLFRQQRLGEWAEVIARVKVALEDAVRTGSLVGPPPALPTTTQLEDLDVEAEATIEADTSTELPMAISRVAEARYGILQYVPNGGVTARSIAWYGEFLQPQVDLLARMIGPDDRLLEVGSGIGAHAIPLAKMLGPRGHLFLYETRPVLRRILQQNLAASRVTETTTLMRRAISGARATPEEGETLDDLLLDRLDLLKIQSDAVTDDILEGASDTLWRLRPKLFVSAPDDTSLADRARQVKAYGYRCWRMESPYFNSGNFYRRDTDIFDGRRSLALLAIPEEVNIAIVLDGCVEWTDASDTRDTAVPGSEPIPRSANPELADSQARKGFLRKLRGLIR